MATGYSIEIDEGLDKKTLDANLHFDHEFTMTPGKNNTGEELVLNIEARGDVNLSTAALIAAEIETLANQCRENIRARRVSVLLAGVQVDALSVQPFEAISGPFVTYFKCGTEDEGGESHMRWVLRIQATLSARQGQENENTYGLKTSLAVRSVNGQVVRKTWRATATSGNALAAEAAVRSYKPSEEKIVEDIETFFQDAKAAGVWVWEARKKGGVIDIVESVRFLESGAGYEEQTRVGDSDANQPTPVLYRKPLKAAKCIIRGKTRAFEYPIEPPAEHYSDNGSTMVRDFEAEETFDTVPSVDFLKTGIWEREWMEVWKSTEGFDPPDHADHAEYVILEPPSNGIVADE